MHPLHNTVGTWAGANAFRMMPDDPFVEAPATAAAQLQAQGHGWLLRYTWEHPEDGEQAGTIFVGSPDQDGTVTAGWVDSWHQQPALRVLTGAATTTAEGPQVNLEAEYDDGWRWQIQLITTSAGLQMVMNNVIPDDHESGAAGPYPVMVGNWA